MSARLEEYGLIGDCETAALVSRAGSIDWLCWPRFDSEACFAALLGTAEHGRWLIEPVGGARRVERRYRDKTLILETTMEAPGGAVTVIDFMPPRVRHSHVVRLVRGDRGYVRMRLELVLRFDYGRTIPWVTRLEDGTLRAIAGPSMVVLRTPAPLYGRDLKTLSEFDVHEGHTVPMVLTCGRSHLPPPKPMDAAKALAATEAFWTQWAARHQSTGEWDDAVLRSLITLEALTYAPTGGIVAAPTTSLPERIGGTRNWDYRFCWLRDATLTLLALMNAGYYDEAKAWRDWLLRAAAGAPRQLQIMYGIGGERRLVETELPWLPGYERSTPVRVGNAAHDQLQLDVYGEVMDALHQARRGGLAPSEADWSFQRTLLEHVAHIWHTRDEGIWEVRGEPRSFTYSKVMAWVALDRGIRAVETCGLAGPVKRWRALRQRIHDEVCERGFDAELNSFVQSYGSKELDASLLLIPLFGFLPPSDPRVRGTVEAISRQLVHDGFVRRYVTESGVDGLDPGEGVFLMCTFWLADNLTMLGRRDEAEAIFTRLLAIRNDVGLLSEEYDPLARRLIGNFPQAFSHVALVNTANNLASSGRAAPGRATGANPQ